MNSYLIPTLFCNDCLWYGIFPVGLVLQVRFIKRISVMKDITRWSDLWCATHGVDAFCQMLALVVPIGAFVGEPGFPNNHLCLRFQKNSFRVGCHHVTQWCCITFCFGLYSSIYGWTCPFQGCFANSPDAKMQAGRRFVIKYFVLIVPYSLVYLHWLLWITMYLAGFRSWLLLPLLNYTWCSEA